MWVNAPCDSTIPSTCTKWYVWTVWDLTHDSVLLVTWQVAYISLECKGIYRAAGVVTFKLKREGVFIWALTGTGEWKWQAPIPHTTSPVHQAAHSLLATSLSLGPAHLWLSRQLHLAFEKPLNSAGGGGEQRQQELQSSPICFWYSVKSSITWSVPF